MSSIISYSGTNPFGIEDIMAKIEMDNDGYLTLVQLKCDGDFTLSGYIKAETDTNIQVTIDDQDVENGELSVTTNWKHIKVNFNAMTNNQLSLSLPTGIYYLYNFKTEIGTINTDYTVAPEDIDAEIGNTRTIAEQANDHFSWIVKSGTSASDFTITDRMANLTAEHINLNGLVTFNGLASDVPTTIIDSINIGGTNLITNTSQYNSGFTCPIGASSATDKFEVSEGEEITFSFDIKSTTSQKNVQTALIEIFNSNNTRIAYWWVYGDVSTKYTKLTRTVTIPSDAVTARLGFRSSTEYENTYRYVQAERGNKITDWSPAPSDISVENIYKKGTTTIDGGKIDTDTLFARDINMGGIFTATNKGFIYPTEVEYELLTKYMFHEITLTDEQLVTFDFNCDGVVDVIDRGALQMLKWGTRDIEYYINTYGYEPVLSDITTIIDPSQGRKMIKVYGINCWGTYVENYFGLDGIQTNNLRADDITAKKCSIDEITATDSLRIYKDDSYINIGDIFSITNWISLSRNINDISFVVDYGGYYKTGNRVFIQAVITLTDGMSSNTLRALIDNTNIPTTGGYAALNCSVIDSGAAYINAYVNGEYIYFITNTELQPGTQLALTGSYICE